MSWPTSLWTIGGVHIYVDEFNSNQDAVIGELHPLDALKNTLHFSGSSGMKARIGGTLVTSGSSGPEYETLKGYTESGTSRTLTTDVGGGGDWKISKVEGKRVQALNYEYPIYRVTVELVEA